MAIAANETVEPVPASGVEPSPDGPGCGGTGVGVGVGVGGPGTTVSTDAVEGGDVTVCCPGA